jgi:chorismate dehydratase
LRVSVVGYLNTAPLVYGLLGTAKTARLELRFDVPAECADALRRGSADLGILPSIEYQRIPGLKILPNLAVASERKVESVLLISRGPIRRAKRVALDRTSRSSAALTQILFARHWRRTPEYLETEPDLPAMLARADAALLIGDPALQFRFHSPLRPALGPGGLDPKENWHVYDLGEEWWRLTNLPFVFAFWVVRAEQARPWLRRVFHDSLTIGQAHIPEIAREAAGRLEIAGGQLERYLRDTIRYRLDAPARAGLECFYRFAQELGLLERVRPLEFL